MKVVCEVNNLLEDKKVCAYGIDCDKTMPSQFTVYIFMQSVVQNLTSLLLEYIRVKL